MRGTGGNRILPADATKADVLEVIARGLSELEAWAEPDKRLDLGAITIETMRTHSGKISVSVTGDLALA